MSQHIIQTLLAIAMEPIKHALEYWGFQEQEILPLLSCGAKVEIDNREGEPEKQRNPPHLISCYLL
jgi:hypothetical protein